MKNLTPFFDRRRLLFFGGLVGALMTLFVTVSLAVGYDGAALVVSTQATSGCFENMMSFDVTAISPRPNQYNIHTLVDVGETRYTDSIASRGFPDPVEPFAYVIPAANNGGTATGAWPLPAETPLTVTIQLQTATGVPLWENRIALDKCNLGDMTGLTTGPIAQLTQNAGFETAGATAKKAARWAGKADDDRRICGGGANVHAGNCAYQLKGSVGTLKQTFKGEDMAELGDQIRLSAWVKGAGLSNNATIKAYLTFPTAPPKTLTIKAPKGTSDYQALSAAPFDVGETPSKITLEIKAATKGTLYVDDVWVMVASNVTYLAPLNGLIPLP